MTLRNELTRAMRKAEAEYWWDGLGNKVKGSSDFCKLVKQMTKKKEKWSERTGPERNEHDTLVNTMIKIKQTPWTPSLLRRKKACLTVNTSEWLTFIVYLQDHRDY